VKRFSFKIFIAVAVLHIFGTMLLIDAGFAELRALKQAMATGQPEESFLWLTVLCWIWQPIEMFCSRVLHVLSNNYLLLIALAWSLVVGASFGALVPRLFRWRHQRSNQAMELTPGRRTTQLSHD
jgi:hypothetical protein